MVVAFVADLVFVVRVWVPDGACQTPADGNACAADLENEEARLRHLTHSLSQGYFTVSAAVWNVPEYSCLTLFAYPSPSLRTFQVPARR